MSASLFLKSWAAVAAFVLIADAVFLGIVARGFYSQQLGSMMRNPINFPVAAIFYVMFSAAIVYLASMRGIDGNWTHAALAGAILGFAAYGTYDITNLATLKDWPVIVSVADLVWGTTLTTAAAVVGWWVLKI